MGEDPYFIAFVGNNILGGDVVRILILCDSMGIGGAETHVLTLSKGLCAKGHSVTVGADYGELTPRLIKECGERLDFVGLKPGDRSLWGIARYLAALHSVIKSICPDVIHAHSRMTAFCVSLLRRMTALPPFRFCVTAHAKYPKSALRSLLSVWGDGCIAVSEDIKENLAEHYRVRREKITVISNGVNIVECEKTDREGENLTFISRLDGDTSHGAYCLCDIADKLHNEYPSLQMKIVGGGSELQTVKKAAKGLPCLEVLGVRADLDRVYKESALVIGVSRVALEGMSAARNVLLFGDEGALGLLDSDKLERAEQTNFTCRGCGVGDSEFLYREIKRFLDLPQHDRDKMAKQNREYAAKYHSAEMMTELTEEVYRRLLTPAVKIAVGGYYGFGNMGDEAILDTLVDHIKMIYPETDLCVLHKKQGRRNGAELVCRYSPISVAKTLLWADIFVLGGGSLLQNETSCRSLVYYCFLIIISKLCGCRCILLSNGIGPINGGIWRRLTALALSFADSISVRDRASAKLVSELTSGRIEAPVASDVCFLAPTEAEIEKIKVEVSKERYAVIALRGDGKTELDFVARALEANCLFGIFVAMDEQADNNRAKKGAAICGGAFVREISKDKLLGIMKGARVVMGERLHSLVFASIVGTPFVALGDSTKVKSFFEEITGLSVVWDKSLDDALRQVLAMPIESFSVNECRKRAMISSLMLKEGIREAKKSKNAKKFIKSS